MGAVPGESDLKDNVVDSVGIFASGERAVEEGMVDRRNYREVSSNQGVLERYLGEHGVPASE